MTIVITGATGQLGGLVVDALLARGVRPDQVVATGRDPERLAALAARGVQARAADYDDPTALREAFAGAERVLLVSGAVPGQRIDQHHRVIEAAAEAGVELLAYTSVVGAGTTPMLLAADHRATEELLAASGVPHALLRNNFYVELSADQVPVALATGEVVGSARDGRLSAASRADLAEAAAVVLTAEGQAGQVYELGGDEGFTQAELAATVAEVTGRPVTYRDVPVDEYAAVLVGAGLPEGYAHVLADTHLAIARGDLHTTSGDLSRLLGRPTSTLREAVEAVARA